MSVRRVGTRSQRIRRNVWRAGVLAASLAFVSSTSVTAYATDSPAPDLVFARATTLPAQTLTWSPPAAYVGTIIVRDAYKATTQEELAAREVAAAASARAAQAPAPAAGSKPSARTAPSATFAPPQTGYSGTAVLAYAEQFVGVVPYGSGANPHDSFMCDGLTQWTFGQFGIHLPRTVTAQQKLGTRISRADARAGDLVVWPGQHVGIYDGTGGIVHAPNWGHFVEHKSSLWGNPIFIRL
jgi:cell wall-associated NlpC family hydrolase